MFKNGSLRRKQRERKGGYKYIKIRGKERMGDEGKLKRR